MKGGSQILPLLFIHKNSDVRPDPVLFRDDAKSKAWIATIQSRQRVSQCRAIDIHLTILVRVGSQGRGDVHSDHRSEATSIE